MATRALVLAAVAAACVAKQAEAHAGGHGMDAGTCKFEAAGGAGCMCKGFEHIACGAKGDAFYKEHVDEVVKHCMQTTGQCSRACTQPLEVLYVHYLECPDRKDTDGYAEYDKAQSACGASHGAFGALMGDCDGHDHDHEHIPTVALIAISFSIKAVLAVAVALLWRRPVRVERGSTLLQQKGDGSANAL